MSRSQDFSCQDSDEGKTLAACLKQWLPGKSWADVRQLVTSRRVRVGREPAIDLCMDPARRVHAHEKVVLSEESAAPPPRAGAIRIRHADSQVVVVEKMSGISTVRHPAERQWRESRRALVPCLDELVQDQLRQDTQGAKQVQSKGVHGGGGRLRIVHRIDKETSGLVVFARTVEAERALGAQFRAHTVHRRYLAIVLGQPRDGTIQSVLVRDRGDGRRGSGAVSSVGKPATTHLEVVEPLVPPGWAKSDKAPFTLVSCRLETGRTHQIRIHMAELGHPVVGDPVYLQPYGAPAFRDTSGAPRLALHAAELGFVHPATGEALRWEMPPPPDLRRLLEDLRAGRSGPGRAGAEKLGQNSDDWDDDET
ncbi:MAG: RluA family pseudouridine synthase, partial [Gemmataceae bacterium]